LGSRDIVSETHDNGSMQTKYRPRTHVIADLSVNHVERFALLCGYSVQRIQPDYGVDLIVYTYPFILVMYDASKNVAYWIHIQKFLQENPNLNINQATQTIYFSRQNILNELAMRQFALYKEETIANNQRGLRNE
jgi:hypothetical protein